MVQKSQNRQKVNKTYTKELWNDLDDNMEDLLKYASAPSGLLFT